MRGIVKVINFLRLPRAKTFGQIHVLVGIAGGRYLLRKDSWITGQVKGLGCEYTRGLMIRVVFSSREIGEPGENHLGLGYANHTDQLIQASAMATVFERVQHVLARRIVASEETHDVD